MKQVKANKQKQKQKQSNKQSQVVIINQQTRRRGPNKPKPSASSGGGGGGGPSVIPYVIPQTQLTAASYQNSAVQPPDAIQQLTQALGQFQQNQNQIYRNPLRMAPFRAAMNPAPIQQVEEPLPEPIQELPNPVMPDIVLQPNFVEQVARPPIAVPISSSMPTYQGFVSTQATNDLDNQVNMGVDAYDDFGGYDAHSPREISDSQLYNEALARARAKVNMPIFSGAGGGMGSYDEIPLPSTPAVTPFPVSNKGRNFTALTQDERFAIEIYLRAKHDKELKKSFDEEQRRLYSRGSKLITQNKKNNPEVIALKEQVKASIARDDGK